MFAKPSVIKSARILSYYIPLVPRLGVSYADRFGELAAQAGRSQTDIPLRTLGALEDFRDFRYIPPDEVDHFYTGTLIRGAIICAVPLVLGGPSSAMECMLMTALAASWNSPIARSDEIVKAEAKLRRQMRKES
jgi:hypothetical protein